MAARSFIHPPRWTEDQLEAQALRSTALFRAQRVEEPKETYQAFFDEARAEIRRVLAETDDLSNSKKLLASVATSRRDYLRFFAAPPISHDDLCVLVDCDLSPRSFVEDRRLAAHTLRTIWSVLDERRFPWVGTKRKPTREEVAVAETATAALVAYQRFATARRMGGGAAQERLVLDTLVQAGFREVKRRRIRTLADAPGPGEFCPESNLGAQKADFVVGLWDRRTMPLECKVSNSYINSVKRLNREAAGKAESWRRDFGDVQVVPTAVLSGVFEIRNLLDAQSRGLALFWTHDLSQVVRFLKAIRTASR